MNARASCVVVGAGRIGCGYVAERLRAAGFGVTLVTRTAERAEAVNRDGSVRVRLLGRAGAQDTLVGPLEAVPAEDRETVTRRIARSSLVAVSVGSARLSDVAPVIAPGLAEHAERINVLVFENEGDARSRLRSLVAAHGGAPVERHGYAGALVDRIVTAREDDVDRAVRFVAESRIGAVVDTGSLRAPLPRVTGIRPVEDYRAHVLRKLYVFSAGHAAAAYLGALHGHRVIAEALDDPEVLAGVLAAMAEGQAGLAVRYGPAFPGGPERRRAELARFRNPALGDTIDRVGRDPIRKLGAEDRIVGPALLAASGGTPPITLAVVAAAAIVLGIQDVVLSRQLPPQGPRPARAVRRGPRKQPVRPARGPGLDSAARDALDRGHSRHPRERTRRSPAAGRLRRRTRHPCASQSWSCVIPRRGRAPSSPRCSASSRDVAARSTC